MQAIMHPQEESCICRDTVFHFERKDVEHDRGFLVRGAVSEESGSTPK